MKPELKNPAGHPAQPVASVPVKSTRTLVLRGATLLIFLLTSVFILQGQQTARDPGPVPARLPRAMPSTG